MRAGFFRDMPHDLRARRENFWFWVFCAVCALTVSHTLAAFGGTYWAMKKIREAAEAPQRAPTIMQPESLLGCPITRARVEEWHRTCRARARMAEVAPK